MPHLTDWVCTGTGGSVASADVADIGTLGATYVLPINVNVSAGKTEISLRHRTANLAVTMEGVGAGASAGVGWSLAPISGTYAGGQPPLSKSDGMNLPSGGIGCVVAGPKADRIVISPVELEGMLTIATYDASFGPNGLSGGIAIFADRPIIALTDLPYIKAFSLVWGFQFVGGSVGLSGGAMFFKCKVRESSLPFQGAQYGASVA